MNELIAIGSQQIGEGSIKTVNARDLHEFLEIKKDFATWIKDRIKKYDFQDGVDFVTFCHSPELGSGNRGARIDYHLTLDMAKELSMVERNAKGKEARQYFLECERAAKAAPAPIAIPTHAEALRLAADALDQNEKLKITISEQAPKVAALDRISTADGMMCITDAAKVLQVRPKDLFAWLSANQWIYRRTGGKNWLGYQEKVQRGLVDHRVQVLTLADGTEKLRESVKITAKGIAYLARVFVVHPKPAKTVPVQMTIN